MVASWTTAVARRRNVMQNGLLQEASGSTAGAEVSV